MRVSLERDSSTPLYLQLSHQLRSRIADGDWKPGERLPSYKEMARHLGVSMITVIQAVDQLVNEGVVVRTRGSGTYVARSGAADAVFRFVAPPSASTPPTTARGLTIGFVPAFCRLEVPTGFFHSPLQAAVQEAVAALGGRILLKSTAQDIETFAQEGSVDGLLFTAVAGNDRLLLHRLRATGTRFVVMGAAYEDPTLPCVATDNAGGTTAAVNHLLELGHRRIGLIDLAMHNPDHEERCSAFLHALGSAGVRIDPRLLLLDAMPTEQELLGCAIDRWMEDAPPFTALFIADYMEALAAMRALRRQGREIPGDVSLITWDDPVSAAHLTPPLTVIPQPIAAMGRRAVEKLVHFIQTGNDPYGTEVLSTHLIVRGSTAPPPDAVAQS